MEGIDWNRGQDSYEDFVANFISTLKAWDPTVKAIIGSSIVKVEYVVLGDPYYEYEETPTIHNFDRSILITTTSGRFVFTWWQSGDSCGVTFAIWTLNDDRLDVTGRAPWPELLDTNITKVNLLKDPRFLGAQAVELYFANGSYVMITPGEVCGGAIRYMPDELLAIFNEKEAHDWIAKKNEYESQEWIVVQD